MALPSRATPIPLCSSDGPGPAADPARAILRALSQATPRRSAVMKEAPMPRYVIERDLPGAGKLTQKELQAVSQKSCGVLGKLGTQIQWVHSYVTDDKIYCIYLAPDERLIREHARQGGFPANRISAVKAVIDPTTAEV